MAEQESPPPRKRGRPAKSSDEKKLNTLGFRARPALRAKIDAAVEESGRSLSEEIEHRLEKSFDGSSDRAAELLFGSRYNVRLMTMFAGALSAISDVEKRVEEDDRVEWFHSEFGQAVAAAAFHALTQQWIAPPDGKISAEEQATANETAAAVVETLYLKDEIRRHERRLARGEGAAPDYATALGLAGDVKK